MQKTIYFHIGAPKTGTTAIESFFTLNRNLLTKLGYLYPGTELDHHQIAQEMYDAIRSQSSINSNSNCIKVLQEIQNTDAHTIIISSDWFYSMGGALQLQQTIEQTLADSIAVKIIFYGRRQDYAYQSAYQQRLKPSTRKPEKVSISESLQDKKYLREFDYFYKLDEWKKAFGKDAIIVRVYEKNQFYNNDLIQDFLHIIGLELTDNFQLPTEEQSNISMGPDSMEFMRLINLNTENKNLQKYWLKSIMDIDRKNERTPFNLLSPHERLEIIQSFNESNQRVAREYLGREEGKLFYEALPDPDEPWEPYEGLTVEKVVPIFAQIIYNMHQNLLREQKNSYFQKIHNRIKLIKKNW
jgi:hypothetical protein